MTVGVGPGEFVAIALANHPVGPSARLVDPRVERPDMGKRAQAEAEGRRPFDQPPEQQHGVLPVQRHQPPLHRPVEGEAPHRQAELQAELLQMTGIRHRILVGDLLGAERNRRPSAKVTVSVILPASPVRPSGTGSARRRPW